MYDTTSRLHLTEADLDVLLALVEKARGERIRQLQTLHLPDFCASHATMGQLDTLRTKLIAGLVNCIFNH